MNGPGGFYGQEYAHVDHHQRQHDAYTDAEGGVNLVVGPMPMAASQSQTLEQLLESQHPYRRRQTFQSVFRPQSSTDHARRSSMMEFGTADFADFAFDPNPTTSAADVSLAATTTTTTTTTTITTTSSSSSSSAASQNTLMTPSLPQHQQHQHQHQHQHPHKATDPTRSRSRDELGLNTQFCRMNTTDYDPSVVSFSPSILSAHGTVEPDNFMPGPMDMSLDFSGLTDDVGSMGATAIAHSMFGHSAVGQAFSAAYSSPNPTVVAGSGSSAGTTPQSTIHASKQQASSYQPHVDQSMLSNAPQLGANMVSPSSLSMAHGIDGPVTSSSLLSQTAMVQPTIDDGQSGFPNSLNLAASLAPTDLPPLGPAPDNLVPNRFHNAYSTSGFDMMGILMRVATRKNPQISIGPVDLSCAFVVCDIDKPDFPIVYCSEMFECLTGYSRYEILGRNCRFLQAPDGNVQRGEKRKYVDDRSAFYLKSQIQKRVEAQLSLINYRKGGQPFMNLLTMIPIPWDTEELRFFVGFQVDLVEQPGSLSGKNPDGTYAINYNRSALPAYSLPAPPNRMSSLSEIGQTIPRDEVSQVLASSGSAGSGPIDLSSRIWDKVLLENTDDVIHVLSLKGLFLYLSPASRRVLEYDASELVGTPLSSVCHPSDIIPVTRELKDSAGGATVSVVYRIRRKKSGYMWFEAHGSLHTEQGKGRKCVILVGRSRPVYALDKSEISTDCLPGDSELWSKLSTAGLILYMSSNSRQMLDRLPDDLVGTSLQALMRPDSKKEFVRVLESARRGHKVTFKHDLQNRRGQVLQAQTTIYPGDAKIGSKPTFLLGQTRLLRLTRSVSAPKSSSSAAVAVAVAVAVAATDLPGHQSPSPSVMSATSRRAPSDLGAQSRALASSFSPQSGQMEGSFAAPGGVVSDTLPLGNQDEALASEDNIFDELKTTRCSSWQFELRQMERQNRMLAEELQGLISRKKKRKRRKGMGELKKDCANCHTRVTPEWRRGPSGQRDLCNSCGLRWAKQNGRVSPRKPGATAGDKSNASQGSASSVNAGPGTNKTASTHNTANTANQTPKGSEPGNLPPQIDEAVEPPHPTVLPT